MRKLTREEVAANWLFNRVGDNRCWVSDPESRLTWRQIPSWMRGAAREMLRELDAAKPRPKRRKP